MSNPVDELVSKGRDFWKVLVALATVLSALAIIPWLERMPKTDASTGQRSNWIQEGFMNIVGLRMPAWLSFLHNPIFWIIVAIIIILIWLKSRNSGTRVMA